MRAHTRLHMELEPIEHLAAVVVRLDDQLHGHLGYPVPDGRDTEGTFCAISFGYHDALYRACCIGLALECFLQLRQKGGYPFSVLYGHEGDAVEAGAPLIGPGKMVGVLRMSARCILS